MNKNETRINANELQAGQTFRREGMETLYRADRVVVSPGLTLIEYTVTNDGFEIRSSFTTRGLSTLYVQES